MPSFVRLSAKKASPSEAAPTVFCTDPAFGTNCANADPVCPCSGMDVLDEAFDVAASTTAAFAVKAVAAASKAFSLCSVLSSSAFAALLNSPSLASACAIASSHHFWALRGASDFVEPDSDALNLQRSACKFANKRTGSASLLGDEGLCAICQKVAGPRTVSGKWKECSINSPGATKVLLRGLREPGPLELLRVLDPWPSSGILGDSIPCSSSLEHDASSDSMKPSSKPMEPGLCWLIDVGVDHSGFVNLLTAALAFTTRANPSWLCE
mmetsp:Transcript_77175/g.120638  ORF Transcript_77175/g.120638 Transcript_77175/m.120638 type:complete len:268 (-) Transcript_77175:297-1100(-)